MPRGDDLTPRRAKPLHLAGQALIAVASVVTLALSVVGYAAAGSITDPPPVESGAVGPTSRPTVTDGLTTRPPLVKPQAMNVLVLGTDTRDGLSAHDIAKYHLGDIGGGLSDTIMLIHLSGDGEHATVMSFPRDLWVEIPAFMGKSAVHMKINAAYARGGAAGPNLAMSTIENLTNIHINHYMSINIPSLGRLVDELGGVDVCLPKAVNDTVFLGKSGGSGLVLPAGPSHLDGVQAVAYVRTRHQDTGDGPDDFGRIRRQQKFVSSLLAKVMSAGTLTDLGKLQRVVKTVASALTLDNSLDGRALFTIASGLQGLNTSRVTFVTVPVAKNIVIDGQDAMQMDEQAAKKLFADVINDRPVTPIRASTPAATPGGSASPTATATPTGTASVDPNKAHTAADNPCASSNG
ncbi:MAG: hypothetical protein QOG52_2875 [Frankiaceae bacterium]|nr:hypothetical protein [Frankiaceae bacterium]